MVSQKQDWKCCVVLCYQQYTHFKYVFANVQGNRSEAALAISKQNCNSGNKFVLLATTHLAILICFV